MVSLKRNYLFFLLRTTINLLFPLLVFPYLCRVLEPSGQGKVTYIGSLVALFTMFSQLGIPTYGVRECSKLKGDNVKLKSFLIEVSIIEIITTIISSLSYVCYVIFFIKDDLLFYFIFIPQIFFNTFVYDYYYTAIENQKFLSIRYLVVRIIELFLIFILVRKKTDLLKYAIILNFVPFLNFIINLYGLKGLVKEKIKKIQLKKHIKPIITIFAASVAVTLYCNFDNVMVKVFVSEEAVGYYNAANRLIRILIVIATSTSAILMPRIQSSLEMKDYEMYGKYSNDYLGYSMLFAIPATMGVIILSEEIILLFAGELFSPAIVSLKLLSPILIIVPLANFFGGMILIVNNKELFYTISVSIAACINLVCNYLLIPIFLQNGAIIGTIIAELTGLLLEIFFAKKYVCRIKSVFINILMYIFAAFVMGVTIYFLSFISFGNILIKTSILILIGVLIYTIFLLLFRDKYVLNILLSIKGKFYGNNE